MIFDHHQDKGTAHRIGLPGLGVTGVAENSDLHKRLDYVASLLMIIYIYHNQSMIINNIFHF